VVRRLYEVLHLPSNPSGAIRRLLEDGVAVDLLDPEIEWHGTVGGLSEGAVARGHEEAIRFMLEDSQEWDELVFEPNEFIDLGDTVVVLQRERRRGRHSGVEVETDTASVIRLRCGKIWHVQGYMDQAEALEAVGLRK
jgi:ketosteroid isomerase-like protein